MATTNWTTDTTHNPQTGQTIVTVTVYDGVGRVIANQWVSAAPPQQSLSPSSAPIASINLGNADVLAEADVAGVALLASVNAGTAALGVTVLANPDPSDTPPVDPT